MSRLVAWKTPFASAEWPSVCVSLNRILRETTIFVESGRRWKISFDYVAALKVSDESYDDNTRFQIERDEADLCSYLWLDSPWSGQFNSEHTEVVEGNFLRHYVLLGGDYNVEVLALGNPNIEIAEI